MMKKVLKCLMFAAAFAAPAAAEWEQFAHDAQGTGHQPITASVTSLDTLAWENGTGNIPGRNNPCVLPGTPARAFTWGTNADGTEVFVHAFRTDSGESIWTSPALDDGLSVLFESTSSPSADSQTNSVYFGTGGKVYRLDAATGAIVWERALDAGGATDIVNGSPHIAGGMVFISSYGGFTPVNKRLYALDADDGSIVWSIQDGGPGSEAPVYVDDGATSRVYTLRDKGMAANNAADGALVWSNAAPSDASTSWTTTAAFFGGPSYHDGDLLAATYDFGGTSSELIRVDGATGRLEWRTTGVINGGSTPTVIGDKIIITGESSFLNPSYIEAYDVATGAPVWSERKADSSTMWNMSAVSTNDLIYFTEGTGGDGLHIVEPLTGADIATSTTASIKATGVPAIGDDGAIYVHHSDGQLACYRAIPFSAAALPVVEIEDFDGNSPAGETNDTTVRVNISGTTADHIRIGEKPYSGDWQPFTTSTTFEFTSARRAIEERTLYIQVAVGALQSPPVSASIDLNSTSAIPDWNIYE